MTAILLRRIIPFTSFILLNLPLTAQHIGAMRWLDNNTALANDTNDWKWHRAIKDIHFSRNKALPSVSFGGEDREQFRYYSHLNFGDVPAEADDEDIYLQHRLLIHSDVILARFLRIFLQLNSCHASGRNPELHKVDRDDLGVMQAFADLNFGNYNNFQLRIGRQEFSYGMERILALRDGPTIRQNFDGIRLRFTHGLINWDLLTARPVLYKPGVFDNAWRRNEYFIGSYLTSPLKGKNSIDLYYFNASFDNAIFAADTGFGHRNYAGLRIGRLEEPVIYELEYTYQTGDHAEKKVRAWHLSVQAGYRLSGLPLKPRVLLRGSVFSGDRKRDDQWINTFRPLSSKPPVYDLTPVGPANIILVSPELDFLFSPELSVTLRYLMVNRYSSNDGIYPSDMRKMARTLDASGMYVLDGIACDIQYIPNKHVTLLLYGGWFSPGNYVKNTGEGKNLEALSLRAHYKF